MSATLYESAFSDTTPEWLGASSWSDMKATTPSAPRSLIVTLGESSSVRSSITMNEGSLAIG